MRMAEASPDTYPAHLEVIKTYKRMQVAFPGTALPANVIVKAPNVNAPAVRSAIADLERRALASGRAHEPITVDVNKAGTVANITMPIDGNGTNHASNESLKLLRKTLIPQTVGSVPNVEAGVTGLTAQWKDGGDEIRSALPLVVAFVLVFAFLLMLVAFRSIVVAAKAIVLNCLSVAAAYGILVLVFQHGIGKGLLGFTSTAGISPVIPLLLFVILFGLSMDYHVFIVSRIRERFQQGDTMDESISNGIRSTAGVVTSAAIVMVCVFAVFATLSMLFFKQFGVGLASAILIDATIVRGMLLPASMKLLGERNWYLPRGSSGSRTSTTASSRSSTSPSRSRRRPPKRKRRIGAARGSPGSCSIARRSRWGSRTSGRFRQQRGLRPRRREGRRADPASVPLRHGAGQLRRRLRDARRAGEPARPALPPDRPEDHADPRAWRPTRARRCSASRAAPASRTCSSPTRAASPGTTTSSSSATAASTARRSSTARGRLGAQALDRSPRREVVPRLHERLPRVRCAAPGRGRRPARLLDVEQVDDLEAARRGLGYGKIDLVSESAGTRTAMIYAWRYPRTIHRSVMIGVNPPGHFLWDPKVTDRLIGRYSRLCGCGLAESMRKTVADLPDRFWGLPIDANAAKIATFYGLMESTEDAAPLSGPMTIDAWRAAARRRRQRAVVPRR